MTKKFNVIYWDFNKKNPEPYDIMPYLVGCYNELDDKPQTLEDFKNFVRERALYKWWSRCEYEVIISNWPSQNKQVKMDIYTQVMMNVDLIAELLMESVLGK